MNEVSDEEIELWVKHVGPVWKQHPELMEAALAAWYAAMQEVGLAEAGENQMEELLLRGLTWIIRE